MRINGDRASVSKGVAWCLAYGGYSAPGSNCQDCLEGILRRLFGAQLSSADTETAEDIGELCPASWTYLTLRSRTELQGERDVSPTFGCMRT